MKKLWQTKNKTNEIVDEYCFSEGVVLDNQLVEQDVYGSVAHAHMLCKIGIITQNEFVKLKKALVEVLKLNKVGKFKVKLSEEDVHTKVETYLTEKLGDLGEKIHAARSRNDQVLIDLRLYAKEQIFSIYVSINRLIDTFVKFGKKYEFIPMPGYTHMQKAMPSSIGLWAESFAESLIDDLQLFKTAFILNDQSPLGSGAAYGVSLPIDRNLTTKLLGFSKVQNNSLYCQASRPKIQLVVMQSLCQIMLTLSRFAQDLLLFTTNEFSFFTVDSNLCTGSSIMPQKKNLDIMEYLRAKTHTVINLTNMIATTSASLSSGYNADFGETKGPFMKTFEIVSQSIEIVTLTLQSLTPNIGNLKKACTSELFATHASYQLVKKGVPFRKAYQKVKDSLNKLKEYDVVDIIKQTNHLGGPGNLDLKKIDKALKQESKWWKKQKKNYEKSIRNLINDNL